MTTFDENHGTKAYAPDTEIEQMLEAHIKRFDIAPLDATKLFPVLARRQWLKRFLSHSQLFQQTLDVPGDIAELGVFRGLGLMTWANLLESFSIGDRTKTVWGFDNWQGFEGFSDEDGIADADVGKTEGGFNPSRYLEELQSAIEVFDRDRFVPWKSRIKLVHGDIIETAPKFASDNPGVRFSLIHFDCDLYAPTKSAIDSFWPMLSRGGVMMFDEYGIPDWPGETKAVDEFLEQHSDVRLQTSSWTNTPTAYLVKP